jgi:assimilatory nitrate reductase catalytic subunit
VGALFVAADPVSVSRAFVAGQLSATKPEQRWQHLAGRSDSGGVDRGAILCSCFEIGDRQIVDAVLNRGCMTVEAVGKALGAGTNCGSCRPEIGRIIGRHTRGPQPVDGDGDLVLAGR